MAYTQMTMGMAIDEVMSRLGQYRTATNLDFQTVGNFVNRARVEAITRTMPFKEWAYVVNDVPVRHLDPIDTASDPKKIKTQNFIKPIRVLLKETADTEYREARYVDIKELYVLSSSVTGSTTSARIGHAWAKASKEYPVYTLWRKRNPDVSDSSRQLIFVASPSSGFPSLKDMTYTSGMRLEGLMDCVLGPDDIDLLAANAMDRKLEVPYEFENIVVTGALTRCWAKLGQQGRLLEAQKDAMEQQSKLRELYAVGKVTARQSLQSTVDQVMQPQQQQE